MNLEEELQSIMSSNLTDEAKLKALRGWHHSLQELALKKFKDGISEEDSVLLDRLASFIPIVELIEAVETRLPDHSGTILHLIEFEMINRKKKIHDLASCISLSRRLLEIQQKLEAE